MTYEKEIRVIKAKIGLKAVCTLDTDAERQCVWDALEKQIPNPVQYIGDGYSDGSLVYDEAECPSCGYIFDDSCCDWESKYCPECGQALDWRKKWLTRKY